MSLVGARIAISREGSKPEGGYLQCPGDIRQLAGRRPASRRTGERSRTRVAEVGHPWGVVLIHLRSGARTHAATPFSLPWVTTGRRPIGSRERARAETRAQQESGLVEARREGKRSTGFHVVLIVDGGQARSLVGTTLTQRGTHTPQASR